MVQIHHLCFGAMGASVREFLAAEGDGGFTLCAINAVI
ncbi:hypothetical protein CEV31_0045 [Brucella thiophenivorans]|uniref:Uncharacterized protein n=1 Tax=Brucella thiophenivorans TaxID=571255 RepID=A0A256G8R7_9HYPH|nr:hypothetical protein CEV31_0045 [Brucella thiophenivorans]